ncbi:MAG: homoserine dehydrogenase [Xanthomonadales bacterium]|nr:homoserine dehydrogenase [Xanthomonadales bacterium]
MSALPRPVAPHAEVALVVLGHGGVGRALLHFLARPAAAALQLVGVADSTRQVASPHGLVPAQVPFRLAARQPRSDAALLAALDASGARRRVIVDATAAETVAARHAGWLAAGYDVVSANKAALGGCHAGWTAIRRAEQGGTRYGDAATVGAGLPVLQTLRRLRECGDRLLAIEGVLSGSLSWLFNRFDGSRPFSELLRQAHAAGYTEPDPRLDLGGADVARKLLILARSAGHALEPADVVVEGLVPAPLRTPGVAEFLARANELDAALEARRVAAAARGEVLRFIGTLDAEGRARVGLATLPQGHPAARLAGTDNLFVLHTQRYRPQPLVIQGPGAGRELTAQALLGDLLVLVARRAA